MSAFTDVQTINVGLRRFLHLWLLAKSTLFGAVYATFATNQLALEGYKAKAFFPEEHGVPAYDELIFVANAKKHDDQAIRAFNKALEQATTYIVNHPTESWKEFVAYSPDTLNNELNQRAWNDTLTRFALRPSAVDLKRYDDYATIHVRQRHHQITAKSG